MNFHRTTAIALLVLAASLLLSPEVLAKDEACTGVAKTCTKDKLYDKEIGGSTYSCYDCKQVLCRDGGDGPIAGTKTTSVCTEKSTSFTPITDDDSSFDTTTEAAPETDSVEQEDPGTHDQSGGIKSELVIMPTSDCSSTSRRMCAHNGAWCSLVHDRSGNAIEICRWISQNTEKSCKSTNGIWTSASSKYARNHPDAVASGSDGACITEVKNIQKMMTDKRRRQSEQSGGKGTGLAAPSNLAVRDVTRTTLTLTWSDNSDREFGVEVYRIDPVAARQNRGNGWEFIGLFEERIMDRVEGTGLRSDQDYELTPATNYCYKLRTFFGFDRKQVSDYSESVCTKTKDP